MPLCSGLACSSIALIELYGIPSCEHPEASVEDLSTELACIKLRKRSGSRWDKKADEVLMGCH